MRRRLRAVRSVPLREVPQLLQVVLIAAMVPLLMRLPLDRLERLLEPRRSPRERRNRWEATPRLVEVAVAGFGPLVRPGCLTRGVTMYALLRRAGQDVSLAFGIGEIAGSEQGHCWLVLDGEAWLETADPGEHFATVTSIPSSRAAPRA